MTFWTSLEFNVPSKYVGRLIGKGGTNVKSIRQSTRTTISFLDAGTLSFPDMDVSNDDTHLCKVGGRIADIESVKNKILELVSNYSEAEEKRRLELSGRRDSGRVDFTTNYGVWNSASTTASHTVKASVCNVEDLNSSSPIVSEVTKKKRQRRRLCPDCRELYTGKYERHISDTCKYYDNKSEVTAALEKEGIKKEPSVVIQVMVKKPPGKKLCPHCGKSYNGKYKNHTVKSDKCRSLGNKPEVMKAVKQSKDNSCDINSLIPAAKGIRKKLKNASSLVEPVSGNKYFPKIQVISTASDDPGFKFICNHKACIYLNTNASFSSLQKLEHHYKKEHPSQRSSEFNQEPIRPFQLSCEMCSRNFYSRRAFKQHQSETNNSNCQMTHILDIHKKTVLWRKVRSPRYECSLCTEGLDALGPRSDKTTLLAHGKYCCEICDTIFRSSRSYLLCSKRDFKEASCKLKQPGCKYCFQTFEYSRQLTQHIRNERFLCSRSRNCTCAECSCDRFRKGWSYSSWDQQWNWRAPLTLNAKTKMGTVSLAVMKNGRWIGN